MRSVLLESIAAGQTRFRMPGLSTDARGMAHGRDALISFESIDRLIGFLGAYSREARLDDLLPTVTLDRCVRSGGGHAVLLRCQVGDSYGIDRLARLSGVTRGVVFTGSGSTFVRTRDRIAPFGYDLAVSPAELGPTEIDEVVTVEHDAAVRYRTIDRIDPVDLIQRLALRRRPVPLGGIQQDPDLCGMRDIALALVAPGLADRVLRYLWHSEVAMAGIRVTLAGDRGSSLLLRLRHPTGKILDRLRGLPGLELFAPVSSRAAVEVGWEHPIHLASASACLPGEEMFLFRGEVGAVERLDSPPRFVDGRAMVRAEIQLRALEPDPAFAADLEQIKVTLRLEPTGRTREPRAVLVEWEHADLLRRLAHLLPPSALASGRVAAVREGILVFSSIGRAGTREFAAGTLLPLGRRLCEVAPGVLVPDGMELVPSIRPLLIRKMLSLEEGDLAVWTAVDVDPILLRAGDVEPLDQILVRRTTLEAAQRVLEADGESGPPQEPSRIVNDRLGRFSLWGFRSQAHS